MWTMESKMRRAHLITPFGVGALSTMVNGVTVITASLDAWFHDFNGNFRVNCYKLFIVFIVF